MPAAEFSARRRSRAVASVALLAVAAVLLLAGVLALYARTQIIEQDSFADRATTALENDQVRQVVTREIVVNLIDRGSTNLVAARPLLETVVNATIQTGAFRSLFRTAALQANRVLFVRNRDNAAFDLADASKIVRFGLKSVSPKLASELPRNVDVALLTLKRREFATQALNVADAIRALGIILPLLALATFGGAIALAPDRRIGILRSGIAIGVVGALLAIALLILRARTLANVFGEDELTNGDVRGAVAGILDAFFGDLFRWALLLTVGGVLLGTAAATLETERLESPATRLRRRLAPPEARWARALWGIGAMALGTFVALQPTLALQVLAILGGAYLVLLGMSELLGLLKHPDVSEATERRRRTHALTAGAVVAGLALIAVVGVILVATSEKTKSPAEAGIPRSGCNGSPALCHLRLDEVVFAGTHNSFSAADSPGWLIANQRRTIARQLQDGIRLFLIDPHWGVATGGRVRTDFEAEGRDRNRVAKALPPQTLAAAQRLGGRLGLGENVQGTPSLWLCHSVCELGATKMLSALETIRQFLDANPGEVVIIFIEPFADPQPIADVFHQAGLDPYLETLQHDAPLPTLGQLVESNKRLIVFTERDATGAVPWYLDGFSFIQDTPIVESADQRGCQPNRGTADSPLLMLNNWADVFPPQLEANNGFQTKHGILSLAHRCTQRRGLPVNFIADDFYDQGDLIPAVDRLNHQRIEKHRRQVAAIR